METPQTLSDASNSSPIIQDSYETVGFHKQLGGFYYNLVLFLLGLGFFIFMFAVVIPELLPYPEIEGYTKVTFGLLGFFFSTFDFGSTRGNASDSNGQLSEGLLRYLGEYSTINPRKALSYVSFFSWFQMITGLIQITLIAILVFAGFFASMAHLFYFILGYSLIQFPGCTQIYESIFRGFVRLDAFSLFTFVKDTVIKYGTQIVFLLVGRWWGAQHPEFGELMGATIGWILSIWGAGIISFIYGSIVFKQKMGKSLGLGISDIFTPNFNKETMKQTMVFSGKLWLGQLWGNLLGLITNVVIILMIPAYGVWIGILSFAYTFSDLVTQGGILGRNSPAAISEAYMNKKYQLFDSYLMNLLKYISYITCYLTIPFTIFFPTIVNGLINEISGLSSYRPIIVILPTLFILQALTGPLGSIAGKLFNVTDRPLTGVLIGILNSPFGLLFLLLFVYMGGTWQAILYSGFISSTIGNFSNLLYFHYKVRKFPFWYKGLIWQVIVAPLIVGLITTPCLLWIRDAFVVNWIAASPILASVIVVIFCLFIFPMFIYSPLYAYFGGMDDNSLFVFKKAIALAGPSKLLMKGFYVGLNLGHKSCRFRNKFIVPFYEEAEKERAELNAFLRKNNTVL